MKTYVKAVIAEQTAAPTKGDELSGVARIYQELLGGLEEKDAKAGPFPCYIHLVNAQVFYPNAQPIPGNRGVAWRGKISSVDAFWHGKLDNVAGE